MSSQFQPEQSTVVSKQDGCVFDVALKSLLRYKRGKNFNFCLFCIKRTIKIVVVRGQDCCCQFYSLSFGKL